MGDMREPRSIWTVGRGIRNRHSYWVTGPFTENTTLFSFWWSTIVQGSDTVDYLQVQPRNKLEGCAGVGTRSHALACGKDSAKDCIAIRNIPGHPMTSSEAKPPNLRWQTAYFIEQILSLPQKWSKPQARKVKYLCCKFCLQIEFYLSSSYVPLLCFLIVWECGDRASVAASAPNWTATD